MGFFYEKICKKMKLRLKIEWVWARKQEKNKDLKKLFLNQYFEKKFFNYLYNYGRIADEYKLPFLERFSQELKEDISRGIDLVKLNNRWIADMALRIMDDYKTFYYEDTIYRLKSEREQVNNRLNSLRNSAELQTGRSKRRYDGLGRS